MNSLLPPHTLESLGITRCALNSSGVCLMHITGVTLSEANTQDFSLRLLFQLACQFCPQAIIVESSGLLVRSKLPFAMRKSNQRLRRAIESRSIADGSPDNSNPSPAAAQVDSSQ